MHQHPTDFMRVYLVVCVHCVRESANIIIQHVSNTIALEGLFEKTTCLLAQKLVQIVAGFLLKPGKFPNQLV